jgi:aspartate kinase
MIVMKFGGTSVQDADAIRSVANIIIERSKQKPLVVVSACAGVTSSLIRIATIASEGKSDQAFSEIEELQTRHFTIADTLLKKYDDDAKKQFARQFDELSRLVKSIAVIQEVTPRLFDQCSAYGEGWSSLLLTFALRERSVKAKFVDARTVMTTNDSFTRAEPKFDVIDSNAKQRMLPLLQDTIVITQGFVGATVKGVTTTLGRGGSDYSAAIFGAALDAEEIQIWTDVDGILTADPNIVSEARLNSEVTFSEAAELAYFGAKVLHPSTILPALKKNIPVRVLNSKNPSCEGTNITAESTTASDCILKSIAYKRGITIITIQSTRMLMAYGFLARVFDLFSQYKKSIDVVATSEVGVSLTVDDSAHLEEITAKLSEFADVRVDGGKAVISVVGEKMKHTPGIAGRVFHALGNAGVNIELISHGGSEINLTFVVDERQVRQAVQSLHKEFF